MLRLRALGLLHTHTCAHIISPVYPSPDEFIHPALARRRIFCIFFFFFLNIVFYVFVIFSRSIIYIVSSRLTRTSINSTYVIPQHTPTHCTIVVIVIVILRCQVRSSRDTALPSAPLNVGQTKFDNIYPITSTRREFSFWFFLTIRSVWEWQNVQRYRRLYHTVHRQRFNRYVRRCSESTDIRTVHLRDRQGDRYGLCDLESQSTLPGHMFVEQPLHIRFSAIRETQAWVVCLRLDAFTFPSYTRVTTSQSIKYITTVFP